MNRDVAVIGGSAGSLPALLAILSSLPPDLPAAIFVAIHSSSRAGNSLAKVVQLNTRMRTVDAQLDQETNLRTIYVAAPDRHLIVGRNHLHVTRGPKEGLHRPSINVMFRSAAASCTGRVVGILLSGLLDDGASGLWEIARHGGVTIVQDPREAPFPGMPSSALQDAPISYKLCAAEIACLLPKLINGAEVPAMREWSHENGKGKRPFSGFTCPECRGPLFQSRTNPIEFECRVGHVFPLRTLIEEESSTQERKLYEAIVSLEEGADLAEYAASQKSQKSRSENLRNEAKQLRDYAAAIRKILQERTATPLG